MGKCGGRELNYVSDVDVDLRGRAASTAPTRRAAVQRRAPRWPSAMMRICSATTAEGTIWPVDAALRPGGQGRARWSGPWPATSPTTSGGRKTWEFQALLKARPVAGDLALGRGATSTPSRRWCGRRPTGDDFVTDVQAMRRRVEQTLPAADEPTGSSSSGPGGLRDVEFAVQLLQLVHGRTDEMLRSPNTLEALEALSTDGYVGRDDAAGLDARLPLPAHARAPAAAAAGCAAPT